MWVADGSWKRNLEKENLIYSQTKVGIDSFKLKYADTELKTGFLSLLKRHKLSFSVELVSPWSEIIKRE